MTEPANYQAAIDALAKACVGLADVVSFSYGHHAEIEFSYLEQGAPTFVGPSQYEVSLKLRDTADAIAHPASREELYEQAMMYFADRLAEIRKTKP